MKTQTGISGAITLVPQVMICPVCKGHRKHTLNFIWKYKNNLI